MKIYLYIHENFIENIYIYCLYIRDKQHNWEYFCTFIKFTIKLRQKFVEIYLYIAIKSF